MNPCFLNPSGYTLTPNIEETINQKKQIYSCSVSSTAPVMFFDGVRKLEIRGTFDTDLGSVPRILHAIPGLGKDDWEMSYLFHDKICKDGGAWCGDVFIWFTREQADSLLYMMVKAESSMKDRAVTGIIVRPVIWLGVRIGAFFGVGVQTNRYSIRKAKRCSIEIKLMLLLVALCSGCASKPSYMDTPILPCTYQAPLPIELSSPTQMQPDATQLYLQ